MNCIKGALRVSGHTPIHDHEADHPIIAGIGMTTRLETMTRAEAPLHCMGREYEQSQLPALQAGVAAAAAGSSACGRPAVVTAAYS